MSKIKHQHNWARFLLYGESWYICVSCGNMPETDEDYKQARKQVRRKASNAANHKSEISERSEIKFWEDFIPYAVEKGIVTKKEVYSLNDSLYNYLELMAEKSQAEEK